MRNNFMKSLIVKLTLVLIFLMYLKKHDIVKAQTIDGLDTLWTRTLGGSDNEPYGISTQNKVAMNINEDGDVFIVSPTKSNDKMIKGFKGYIDCWLVKLNSDGDTLWTKAFGGEDADFPSDVIALKDGGCMVSGFTYSLTGDFGEHHGENLEDGFIARFDNNGNLLWGKQYGGFETEIFLGRDYLNSLIQINDTTFVAVGQTASNNGDLMLDMTKFYSGWFLKVNDKGKIIISKKIASKTHNEYNPNKFLKLTLTNDKAALVLLGQVTYGLGARMFWIVKTDFYGNVINQVENGCELDNIPAGITTGDDNSIYINGSVFEATGDITGNVNGLTDFWIAKLNDDLQITKQNIYGGNQNEICYNLKKDANQDYFSIGMSNSVKYDPAGDSLGTDFFIVKFDKELNPIWHKKFGGLASDIATDLCLSSDNKTFYIAGRTESNDGYVHGNHGMMDVWAAKFTNSTVVINEKDDDYQISIFPNPTEGNLNISSELGVGSREMELAIYDYTGRINMKKIIELRTPNSELRTNIDITSFPSGIYFMSITSNGNLLTKKIIKL